MYFDSLLRNRGIDPKKVVVMRHVPDNRSLSRATLEDWARNHPRAFNTYQRGQGGLAGQSLTNAKYLASFIGEDADKARFVGLYRVGAWRQMSDEDFLRLRENQELIRRFEYSFRDDRPSHLWFNLNLVKSFEDLRFKIVIDWPGRPNGWYRWADPKRNKFRVLKGDGPGRSIRRSPLSGKELKLLGDLDKKRQVLTREEQGILRARLLGGSDHGTCFLCGEDLPVELLVAAHIKPRSKCSDAERKDWANVVRMCLLGCDALFERGHVTVLNDRLVIGLDDSNRSKRLNATLKFLRGRRISLEPGQRKYFKYRSKLSRIGFLC